MTTHFQMYYIILYNITYIQNIYHLVMTNIAMERSTHFKFGKPSISTRAIYTMAMLVITRLGSFFFFRGDQLTGAKPSVPATPSNPT